MAERIADEKLEHMEELADLWVYPTPQLQRSIGPYATTLHRFARNTKELIAELKQTREELDRAREALRLYADENNWSFRGSEIYDDTYVWLEDTTPYLAAQEALNPPDENCSGVTS